MAWNGVIQTVSPEDQARMVYVNLQFPETPGSRENVKFIIGGIADKRIYKYFSRGAYEVLLEKAPQNITRDGVLYSDSLGLRREHMIPNKFVLDYLFANKDTITVEEIQNIMQLLNCALITLEEDKLLNNVHLRTRMPAGWNFGDSELARYEVAGLPLFTLDTI